jgi:uncharacterized membrane protein YeiH
MEQSQFLAVIGWVATLTFAASGAVVAVQKRFDLVGVLVLTGVTAVGGGVIRDVLVGSYPPQSLKNEVLLWVLFIVGLGVWRFSHRMQGLQSPAYYLDTIGLGLFAALGAEKALASGLGFWGCVFVGTLSAVGGGVLRDVLAGEVPGIFYRNRDLYASAAAGGAGAVFVIIKAIPEIAGWAVLLGAWVTMALRFSSRWLGVRLPDPRE